MLVNSFLYFCVFHYNYVTANPQVPMVVAVLLLLLLLVLLVLLLLLLRTQNLIPRQIIRVSLVIKPIKNARKNKSLTQIYSIYSSDRMFFSNRKWYRYYSYYCLLFDFLFVPKACRIGKVD